MAHLKFVYIALVSIFCLSCIVIFSMSGKSQKLINFVPAKHSTPPGSSPATTDSYIIGDGGQGGVGSVGKTERFYPIK